jgi:hypothetical protein
MLSDSLSAKLCPRDRSSDFSCCPTTSPSKLSVSSPPSTAVAELRTLALSSASLALRDEPMFRPKYVRAFEGGGAGESSCDSFW